MLRLGFGALVAIMLLLVAANKVAAKDAVRFCREKGTDDTPRPLPQSIVPKAKQVFGLEMPDKQVRRSTVFRCAEGRVLLCNYGANLPCGKADADRRPRGVAAWCRKNPDADFVPSYARPGGSIYDWRCVGGVAEIASQAEEIDPRGFVARYWKPLD